MLHFKKKQAILYSAVKVLNGLKISFRSRLKRRRNYHRRTYKDRSLFRIPLYILKYHSQSVITLLSPMMNSVTVRQVKNTRRMLRLYGRSNRLKQNTVWQLLKNRKHYHGMSVGAVLQTVSRKNTVSITN